MRTLKSQKGFSITEILIAMSITGGLSLVTANLLSQQSEDQRWLKTVAEVENSFALAKTFLSDRENCRSVFAGVSASDGWVNMADIKVPVKSSYTTTGTGTSRAGTYGQYQVLFQSSTSYPMFDVATISVRIPGVASPSITTQAMGRFQINFVVETRRVSTISWGQSNVEASKKRLIRKMMPIIFTLNAAKTQITDCVAAQTDTNLAAKEKVCKSLGGAADWNSLLQKCDLKTTMNCPTGQVPTSLTSLGQAICRPVEQVIQLNTIFDETASCANTNKFSFQVVAGKLQVFCAP